MDILSHREHSEFELRKKLQGRNFLTETVEQVIGELKDNDYLSDDRYTEVYVRSRIERGDGPIKIRHELARKGVSGRLIDLHLDHSDDFWEIVLRNIKVRKFGAAAPGDYKEWATQARFLQSRGFTAEQIRKVVSIQEPV